MITVTSLVHPTVKSAIRSSIYKAAATGGSFTPVEVGKTPLVVYPRPSSRAGYYLWVVTDYTYDIYVIDVLGVRQSVYIDRLCAALASPAKEKFW